MKKIVLYKINNKNILLKGAGWTPDLFLRQSPENYYNHIKYVRDMGLNTIRLEGKSEGEEFYEYCDKLGILLIPGWNSNDAWQNWKYWDKEVNDLADYKIGLISENHEQLVQSQISKDRENKFMTSICKELKQNPSWENFDEEETIIKLMTTKLIMNQLLNEIDSLLI